MNLGLQNAQAICEAVRADHFVETHSEEKACEGVLRHLASTKYASLSETRRCIPILVEIGLFTAQDAISS